MAGFEIRNDEGTFAPGNVSIPKVRTGMRQAGKNTVGAP